MRNTIIFLWFATNALAMVACSSWEGERPDNKAQWVGKEVSATRVDSLVGGKSYLSVYSQIYSFSEQRLHDLTATISIRNVNPQDSIFLLSADYYGTNGDLIHSYLPGAIGLAPLETISIVIEEVDKTGGVGANFLFDWKTEDQVLPPHFEAVMISTLGQQGLSFTTQGIRIE